MKHTDFNNWLNELNKLSRGQLLKSTLASDAILCSDGAAPYRLSAQHLGLTHHAVNLTE